MKASGEVERFRLFLTLALYGWEWLASLNVCLVLQVGNPLRGISGGVISIDSDAMITVLIFIAEYYQRRILIRRLGPAERYTVQHCTVPLDRATGSVFATSWHVLTTTVRSVKHFTCFFLGSDAHHAICRSKRHEVNRF